MDETVDMQQDVRGQWFVIQTLSGHENKVRDTINRQLRMGDQVPVYEALITENKVKEIPGYVLVRMDLYDENGAVDEKAWYFVRSVQGVLGFLGDATRPMPLSEAEFLDMNPAMGEDAPAPMLIIGVKVGDMVRIKDGAFLGCEGKVMAIDETRGRLTVEILLFGRTTPADLEFWQVEAAV